MIPGSSMPHCLSAKVHSSYYSRLKNSAFGSAVLDDVESLWLFSRDWALYFHEYMAICENGSTR